MTSDNISSLFAPDPNKPAGAVLGQGIVQSWNADTGENEILFAGGTLANIPSLTSEAVNLAADDVVALAVSGDKMLVLGKVTTPGDPGTVPTWPTDISALDTSVTTLNTVTIPAVQADVTTAQSTADTAQTTAAAAQTDATAALSKFPITATEITDGSITTPKLAADAIDGITITGSLIRTAASGQRLELDSNRNGLEIYSGAAGELQAGEVTAGAGSGFGSIEVVAPLFEGVDDARLSLVGQDDGTTSALLRSTSTQIYATDDVLLKSGDGAYTVQLTNTGLFRLGTEEFTRNVAAQALTNKDLTSATNTFPFRIATGNFLFSTPGAGSTTAVSFPAGRFTAAPIVVATPRTTAVTATMQVGVSGETSSGFNLSFRRTDNVGTNVGWIAIQTL